MTSVDEVMDRSVKELCAVLNQFLSMCGCFSSFMGCQGGHTKTVSIPPMVELEDNQARMLPLGKEANIYSIECWRFITQQKPK